VELLSNQGPEFVVELNCKLPRQWGIKRQYATAYHPQTNGQVEQFNRMLKTIIDKFVNGRQDNWDVYLLAFLYAYRTSPHKSMGHTPYEAMLGRAPSSKDRAATELIPMDGWVQELRVAQEEARKLILGNIESEQQDRVEPTPHQSQMWKAGDQVTLWADRKGKGQSKASRSSATTDGVQNPRNTADGVQAGRGR